jgi:hypothetical protein
VEVGEAGIIDQFQCVLEHTLRFGWKAGYHVGAERHFRPKPSHPVTEGDDITPSVTPFHALQDQIVSRLDGKVEMRHQAVVFGDGPHQLGVNLNGIDRGKSQPLELWQKLEQSPHQ